MGKAALCALVLAAAARSWASTVVEPIARLSLEGGYDSNALFNGSGPDSTSRVSPDVGLRLRDHLWDLRAVYGGDWVYYRRLAPDGFWNQRATLDLSARPTRRTKLMADVRGWLTQDPMGLATLGIFNSGKRAVGILHGDVRLEYRAERDVDLAAMLIERTAIFDDHTGGIEHQPSVEALRRLSPRLSLGGAYAFTVFQELDPGVTQMSYAHGARGRVNFWFTRHVHAEAYVGPAFWHEGGNNAIVPEAGATLFGASRDWDYRLMVQHGLGIGLTARPSLVNNFEFGASRRFARRYELHADGGLWNSGTVPYGNDSATGFGVSGEAALLVGGGVRLGIAAAHYARVDVRSAAFDRTTVGLRLRWELRERPGL
jgi:hypothetical protein